ncbi:MAG: hypothetical protein GFH25_541324n34 [Chloroflexi bacterium AL-N10]|nr:hypothetical protein [Chloroflexi bacterium AL-N10]
MLPTIDITNVVLRSSPEYQLILYDHLPSHEQQALVDLLNDPNFYGILRHKNSTSVSMKAVNRDTALLFLTLMQEAVLPRYVVNDWSESSLQSVISLILDGILQMKVGNEYLSGQKAYQYIYNHDVQMLSNNHIGNLSLNALKYAQHLAINDLTRLSARIYFYNRIPVSAYWKALLPDLASVRKFLEFETSARTSLSRWVEVRQRNSQDWIVWSHPNRKPRSEKPRYTFKLYISSHPESLPKILPDAIEILLKTDSQSFKVGADVYGLLRPDKFVAYFWSLDSLNDAAQLLVKALDGVSIHGTPFTCEIGLNGLLSWGVDPPQDTQLISWQERESWRLWLTNRLASYMLSHPENHGEETWLYALNRLRTENVDPIQWTPLSLDFGDK